MKLKWIALVVAAALVAGGGAFAAYRVFFASAEDDALALVPEDAQLYFNAFLDPSTSQKQAIEDLLARFPTVSTPDKAHDFLADLFDRALQEADMTFEGDIEPWLGKQVALFFTDFAPEPSGAGLIATDDQDATQAAIDKLIAADDDEAEFEERTYEGVEYQFNTGDDEGAVYGFVEDFLVIGTEAAFKDVVDTLEGDSLADSSKYQDATDELTDDRLALFYVDVKSIVGSLQGAAGPAGFLGLSQDYISETPFTSVVFARSDGVVIETAQGIPEDESLRALASSQAEPGLVPELPQETWAALGFSSFGRLVEMLYDQFATGFGAGVPGFSQEEIEQRFTEETGLDLRQDILAWIGDIGIFAEGTSLENLRGGVVIESLDPATSSATLDTLATYARSQGLQLTPVTIGDATGFQFAPEQLSEQESTEECTISPKGEVVCRGRTAGFEDNPFIQPVFVVDRDDRVVIAYGELAAQEALEAPTRLGDSDAFRAAAAGVGAGYSVSAFFDLAAIRAFAESFPPVGQNPQYLEEIKPHIEPLSYLASGSRIEGDVLLQRLVIGVR